MIRGDNNLTIYIFKNKQKNLGVHIYNANELSLAKTCLTIILHHLVVVKQRRRS